MLARGESAASSSGGGLLAAAVAASATAPLRAACARTDVAVPTRTRNATHIPKSARIGLIRKNSNPTPRHKRSHRFRSRWTSTEDVALFVPHVLAMAPRLAPPSRGISAAAFVGAVPVLQSYGYAHVGADASRTADARPPLHVQVHVEDASRVLGVIRIEH